MAITNPFYRDPIDQLTTRVSEMRHIAVRIDVLMRKDQREDGLSVKDDIELHNLRMQFRKLRELSSL